MGEALTPPLCPSCTACSSPEAKSHRRTCSCSVTPRQHKRTLSHAAFRAVYLTLHSVLSALCCITIYAACCLCLPQRLASSLLYRPLGLSLGLGLALLYHPIQRAGVQASTGLVHLAPKAPRNPHERPEGAAVSEPDILPRVLNGTHELDTARAAEDYARPTARSGCRGHSGYRRVSSLWL